MEWNTEQQSKQRKWETVKHLVKGKEVQQEDIVALLEGVIAPGDKVALEGCNQKQAAFLSAALADVSPEKVHDINLVIPAVSRDEHLALFEKGIASEINFSFCGTQAKKMSEMVGKKQIKIGAIHTYLELYARLFVDLTPQVALIAADSADEDGNLYTGFNTEDTPTIAEACAFKNGIVIAQVNRVIGKGEKLPRTDIPGDWVDVIVASDAPYPMEPLFTRDPKAIRDEHILMAMMVIKGIYAKHGVRYLNHGVGYNGAAIELLLPTYGEELGLKGKICTHWILNPHPTMIPAIEAGWVKQIFAFGGELGMERYTAARPDIFFTGKDGTLRSNRAMAQVGGLYGVDLFLGGTLQMDYLANSTTVASGRISGFGGAPNMGNHTGGRRHVTKAWADMASPQSMESGRKLVVQMMKSASKFGPGFVEELDAVKIGKEAGMEAAPVMIYGEDVTHMVTEQGIAYLYRAESLTERTKLLGAVAQNTPIAEKVSKAEIETFRKEGKIAYPEDLEIDPGKATRSLLAAQSLEDLVDISGGLYDIPERFRSV